MRKLGLTVLLFLFLFPTIVHGEQGAAVDDLTLTPENYEKWLQLAEQKDKEQEELMKERINILSNPEGEFYTINVTINMQEKGYWCGPASARQSLSFHKSKSESSILLPSQQTLASKIGTTTDGSSTTGIANALNSYKDTYSFDSLYVAADISNLSNPLYTFETRIKNDLKNQTNAPILLVETQYLTYYKGKQLRHYVTVSGYSYEKATGKKMIRIVDPNYDTNYYGTHWEALGSTKENGVFRAVYNADLNGSNMAMAY